MDSERPVRFSGGRAPDTGDRAFEKRGQATMATRRKQGGGSRLRAYGLLILVVLGIACLVGWGVGKVLIAPSPETTPRAAAATALATQLATADGGVALPVDYQTALDGLAAKCTQDEATMASLVNKGHADLVAHGIQTLTRIAMLQYLNGEISAGQPKADCAPMLSTYVTANGG
jgi:hypothetical protein